MLSFVIPARNEAASIPRLFEEIDAVCVAHGYEYEVILIDDGSVDGTWDTISQLATTRSTVRGIRLRRNFGKGPAMSAGFAAAQGRIVLTMDADLQDNPADVPAFLAALDEGHDVVVGWRETRRDSWFKRLQSGLFNKALDLTGLKLHDHNCGFKCLRVEVLRGLRLYGDRHRYVPVLAHIDGFKVAEIKVNHRARIHGTSNYDLRRTYRGFFDLLTILFLKGFRYRPMHFLGSLGLGSLLLGILGLAYLALAWIVQGQIGFRPLLIYSTAATIFGSQILATGFLAELLIAYLVKQEDLYSVREEIAYGEAALRQPALGAEAVTAPSVPRKPITGATLADGLF